jgi:hypothetical protein
MGHSFIRLFTIITLGLVLVCGCLLTEGQARERELRKDRRWHTETVDEGEFSEEVRIDWGTGQGQPTGEKAESPGGTAVITEGADPVVTGTSAEGSPAKTTGLPAPSVVAPVANPPDAPGEHPAPDGRRDNLEAAKEMLEKQLEKLRKAREEREGKGKPAATAEGPGPQGDIQPGPVRDVITLYLDPLEARPEMGQRFVSTVELENPSGKEFDEVGFVLRYNPKVLRVIDGDEAEVGTNVHARSFRDAFPWEDRKDYINRVDEENGLVTYRAKWRDGEPLTSAGPIAAVTFEVIRSVESRLDFVFREPSAETEMVADGSPLTFVRLRGEDVLGRRNDPEDGTVYAAVKFYEEPEEREPDHLPRKAGQDLMTRIVIYPAVDALFPGQEFDYVVQLDNPNRVDFDEVALVLGYNPTYLQPIDHDQGNFISKGLNLFDGDFHETFPFNHHRRNEVDTRRGVMVYQMGTLRTALNASGVVASARFRALAPTGEKGTRLKVGFVRGSLESGLTRRGEDVLGDPEEWKDGFEVYPVFILPTTVSQK